MAQVTGPTPAQMKTLFLQTALDESIALPAQNYVPGQELRFQMPNVGVAKKVRILFNLSFTAGTTAPSGVGAKAPFSLFTLATFTDYAGIDRISASPWALNLLNLVKKFGWDASYSVISEPQSSAQVWTNTDTSMIGWFDIPIAPSNNDPTGSLNLEVSNAECYLRLQCNPNLVGATTQVDTPLVGSSGASATVSGTITPVYYFWQPVSAGGRTLRPDAILYPNIVHEVLGTKSSDNIAAGMDKVTTLRTNREFHRVLHHFVNNGAFDTNDVKNVKFLYNGNTPTINEPLQAYLSRIRDEVYRDLPDGTFYFNFTRVPWDSTKWGQLQTVLSIGPNATISSPYLETLTEAFYTPQ
ncbi:MAG: hypothetical protein QXI12_06660 [Candidatus Methanomethyliaceae archaeon]